MKKIDIINQNIDNRYLELFYSLYSNEKNISYFLSDIKISIEYTLSTKDIYSLVFLDKDVLIGHCSIIKPKEGYNGTAYFGFFEIIENQKDFTFFWNQIILEAKKQNIKKLIGPINGSIWFPYRFVKNSNYPYFFKGELPVKLFYNHFFSSLDNIKVVDYSSGLRKDFNLIIENTKKQYDLLINSTLNLKFDALPEFSKDILDEIYNLAKKVFSPQSIAYEQFSNDYFLKLYSVNRVNNLFKIYTVRSNEKLVAFCSVFYENEKVLILKTLAVDPAFQKYGIGSALVYLIHLDAKEKNIKEIIYALIRDDNNIKFFPKDDVLKIRTYSLFEFNI